PFALSPRSRRGSTDRPTGDSCSSPCHRSDTRGGAPSYPRLRARTGRFGFPVSFEQPLLARDPLAVPHELLFGHPIAINDPGSVEVLDAELLHPIEMLDGNPPGFLLLTPQAIAA